MTSTRNSGYDEYVQWKAKCAEESSGQLVLVSNGAAKKRNCVLLLFGLAGAIIVVIIGLNM